VLRCCPSDALAAKSLYRQRPVIRPAPGSRTITTATAGIADAADNRQLMLALMRRGADAS
jgi:hypothetical protein